MSPEQIQMAIDEVKQLQKDGRSLRAEGKLTSSLKHFADANDIACQLAALPKHSRSDKALLLVAQCETGFGNTHHRMADFDGAIQRYNRAIPLRAQLARSGFDDPYLLAHRAVVHYNVSTAHNRDLQADICDAYSNCEASFHLFARLLESDTPDDQRCYVNQFLEAANLYAHCLQVKGRHGKAKEVVDRALGIAHQHRNYLTQSTSQDVVQYRRRSAKSERVALGSTRERPEKSVFAKMMCRLFIPTLLSPLLVAAFCQSMVASALFSLAFLFLVGCISDYKKWNWVESRLVRFEALMMGGLSLGGGLNGDTSALATGLLWGVLALVQPQLSKLRLFMRVQNWIGLSLYAMELRLERLAELSKRFLGGVITTAETKTRRSVTAIELLTQHTLVACQQAFDTVCDVVVDAFNSSARQRAGPYRGRFERPPSIFSLPGSGVRPWRPLLARGDGLSA